MKKIVMAAGALALGASVAQAGGFDRSGLSMGAIFEKGNYAEFSLGYVVPSVRNVAGTSGDIGVNYITVSGAVKQDLSDSLSFTLMVDQPWGATVQYPAAFGNANAYLESVGITGVLRYKFSENWSVHGGLRYVAIGGSLSNPLVGVAQQSFEKDPALGYLIGAAYERPDIALRVALTYFSETKHELTSNLGNLGRINPPQSVNLDFQTGIAKDTLLFGSVRWADWTSTRITVGAATVVSYRKDTLSYSLGVGRRFNDTWSGAVSFGYEAAQGGNASPLAPVDGNRSISIGATYTKGDMKITGGIRYVQLGDATAATGVFRDNDVVGIGVKVGFAY